MGKRVLHDYNDYPITDEGGTLWTRAFEFHELSYKVRYPMWISVCMFTALFLPTIITLVLVSLLLLPIGSVFYTLAWMSLLPLLWPKLDRYVFKYVDEKQLWKRFKCDIEAEEANRDQQN